MLEASDDVGGRVRTDRVDGFLLDRGFQVLLTGYPEAQAFLYYEALDLQRFTPGALVRRAGRFERVADPLRRPSWLWSTLRANVGSLRDKFLLAQLRRAVRSGIGVETTTEHALRRFGFSNEIIDTLFRPWFGGVFLDRSLAASSKAFEFTFRMFGVGDTALPAQGMGAIPKQIADRLPEGTIHFGARVERIEERGVQLHDGTSVQARATVIATNAVQASRLLDVSAPPPGRGVRTLFFDAPEPPVEDPILVLDGDGAGPVNDLCVVSNVAPSYAPPGRALVSASVLDHVAIEGDALEHAARAQLTEWFGREVGAWRHLRTVRVPFALPDQRPGVTPPPLPLRPGLFVCGDHREAASLQGAMLSGRRAADAILGST